MIIKDIDGNIANDEIDTLNLIVPFQQNATVTHFGKTKGFQEIVEFSFNYTLHNNYESIPGKNMNTSNKKFLEKTG